MSSRNHNETGVTIAGFVMLIVIVGVFLLAINS